MPIVNENDTVATHEIRFGDNDRLASLVAHLVHADGLRAAHRRRRALRRAAQPAGQQARARPSSAAPAWTTIAIGGTGSSVGSGGMVTKVEAASIANAAGITTVLTSAEQVEQALAGEDVGTVFVPDRLAAHLPQAVARPRHARPMGRLLLDPGAVRAVTERRTSLLPAGITGGRGHLRRRRPGRPVRPRRARGRPRPGQLHLGRAARHARAARRVTWPRSWARSTSARSSTATTSSLL